MADSDSKPSAAAISDTGLSASASASTLAVTPAASSAASSVAAPVTAEATPIVSASVKRQRDDDDDEEKQEKNKPSSGSADNEESLRVEVRDANGVLLAGQEEFEDGQDKPAKRRKSGPSNSDAKDANSSIDIDTGEVESTKQKLTTDLGAEPVVPKNVNSADLPNELPDSANDEVVNNKGENGKTDSADVEPPVVAPSTPSGPSFLSSTSTSAFKGGFGGFAKSGFTSALSTPKASIFESATKSSSTSETSGISGTPSQSTPSLFKGGFSGFGTSGFQTPQKENMWAEAKGTPKINSTVKSIFGTSAAAAAASGSSSNTAEADSSAELGDDTRTTAADADAGSDDLYVQLSSPLSVRKVETGEEAEVPIFTCRSKLYALDLTLSESGWKERGVGTLHVNMTKVASGGGVVGEGRENKAQQSATATATAKATAKSARLVMRADGLLRVILNLPLQKSFKAFTGMNSSLQGEKFVRVSAIGEEGKPVQYAFRTNNAETARTLFKAIQNFVSSD